VAVKEVYNLEPKLFLLKSAGKTYARSFQRSLHGFDRLLFRVRSLKHIAFLRWDLYFILYMFPVYVHADLVRESNIRSDSLMIVVDLFLSGQPVLMHLYWCRGVRKVMPRWKLLLWFHDVRSVVLPSCESKRSGFFKCRLQANDASFHYFWLAVLPSHSLILIREICPLQMSHAPFWNAANQRLCSGRIFNSSTK
jgi:hypothetical protein